MSENSIESRAKQIIIEQLGVDFSELTASAHFANDLGADSLDTVELTMAMEEEFNLEIPDEVAEKLETVGQVVEYVKANAR